MNTLPHISTQNFNIAYIGNVSKRDTADACREWNGAARVANGADAVRCGQEGASGAVSGGERGQGWDVVMAWRLTGS